MVVVLVMLVALLGASLAGWRVSSAKSSELKGQLIVTKILAESATEAAMVQAKRIKELNDEVDKLVGFIGEELGAGGLVTILNSYTDGVYEDPEGGDDDDGVLN